MPSLTWNHEYWGDEYAWPDAGGEWSACWGGVDTHWHSTVLPRIQAFLPAGTVVEIAPGLGRWTSYLIPLAERFIGIDLAESCVQVCRERFADAAHATFETTDGKTLVGVADGTADLVFSFDSLVHAEADVMRAYVEEIQRVLSPDGVAVLHHSNLGSLRGSLARADALVRVTEGRSRVARRSRYMADRVGLLGWEHGRARSMTAGHLALFAGEAGLACVGQEIINWGSDHLIDCISVLARPESRWARPNVVLRNTDFMAEARSAFAVSRAYPPALRR